MTRRGRGRGDRADRQYELELLTLEAARSSQADDHRRRSEPDPGAHKEPAGEVDRVHSSARACEAEWVRHLRERLGVAPGAQRPRQHEQCHPDEEAPKRRPPAPRREPPVRKQEQREAEQSRGRLADHAC